MKKLILLFLIGMFSTNLYPQSQQVDTVDEHYYINNEMSKDIDTIVNNLKKIVNIGGEIGQTLKDDHKKIGTTPFIQKYKYLIATVLLLVFLSILWARNRN